MKKGQTWSTDAIVAVSIFLAVSLAILYIFSSLSESEKFEQLSGEGEFISESVARDEPGFVVDNKLDQDKLQEFANRTYDDLKSLLGVRGEFCIHLEDEEGNLINISKNITGIGNPRAKVSGVECVGKI